MELVGATLRELEELSEKFGEPKYRGRQLAKWLYKKGAGNFDEMTDLPLAFRENLEKAGFTPLSLEIELVQEASDGTKKYLFRLKDGRHVEGVFIPEEKRKTVCFSTQVGCAMGCAFCATGRGGFVRNLSAGEIVDQIRRVGLECGARITNAVAMGQGEPLANYEAVMKAICLINADYGLNMAARQITVSTCGLIHGIYKLAEEKIQINLAVSLHSTKEKTRDYLVPVNKRNPLSHLLKACRDYAARTNRRVTLEYIMIKGFNDTEDELYGLVNFCRGWLCHVNLIPANPVPGTPFQPSEKGRVNRFLSTLRENGVAASVREERGGEIAAACGQLRQRFTEEPTMTVHYHNKA